MTTNTRIYIANLGKYNEGELMGEWVNLPIEDDELEEVYIRIKVAHRDENGGFIPSYTENGIIYEETAIHGFESDVMTIDEYDSIETLNELAYELEALDVWEVNAVKAYCEAFSDNLREAIDSLNRISFWNGYTMEDLAYELVEECYFDNNTPDFVRNYFDYKAFARDLGFDGYCETSVGVICNC